MLPQVFRDMMRTSFAVAAKVPELWAKVGGGRSRVAGSGLYMGPIVPSSVDGEAGSPRPAAWGSPRPTAWGEGAAVKAGVAPCAEGARW